MKKLFAALALAAFHLASEGATLFVSDPGDSGANSLRGKVAAANNGDTILFTIPGPISLTSGEILINKNLTINGPAGGITVERASDTGGRIFRISNGTNTGPIVSLSNLVIANGIAPATESGSGIANEHGQLTLQNCTVRDCRTIGTSTLNRGDGAGVYSLGSNAGLAAFNCVFSGNDAGMRGGGILSSGGALTIEGCFFTGNEANRGGHISISGTVAKEVRNSTFMGSPPQFNGGAIENSGPLTVTNCTFYQNRSGVAGMSGGISTNGTVLVQHCTFQDNGGGSAADADSIGHSGANFLTLRNNIFSNKSVSSGPNLVDNSGTIISSGYNLANDNGSGFLTGAGDQINTNPQLDPAGLQNNGGPTPTIALIVGSPAIDRGNSFGLTTDQRGAPRPVNNPSVANLADGADIGAYETPADPLQNGSSSWIVQTTADHDDGTCGVGDCTLREAITRANTVQFPNLITFAPGVTGTISLQLAAGQLTITDGVTINGPGARLLTVSGQTNTRIFFVTGGSSTITGLTIGGGWVANSNSGGNSEGGGIYNDSTLSLADCVFDFNRAHGGSAFVTGGNGGSGRGGGIFNDGTLTLNRCTFKSNGATGGFGANNPPPPMGITIGGAGGDGRGAGVYNNTGASLTITNCTFTANSAGGAAGGNATFGGNGGQGLGGAIYNLGTLDISASTFSGNSGVGGAGGQGDSPFNNGATGLGAGGLATGGGTSTVRSSISAGNNTAGTARHDAFGDFVSGGFNLIGKSNGSTGFTAPSDQTGTNAAPLAALLGMLANNGGLTDTMALLANSPALDRGNSFSLASDQRGFARAADSPKFANASGGDGADVGAFEVSPFGGIIDTDGDGMPDEFEIFFNLDDPNADMDGDGDSNLEEYLNGTDPCDSNSVFRILAIERSGNDIVITFRCVGGKTYRLERKDAITDSDWLTIPTTPDITPAMNGTAQLTHVNGALASHSFYRVRLVP